MVIRVDTVGSRSIHQLAKGCGDTTGSRSMQQAARWCGDTAWGGGTRQAVREYYGTAGSRSFHCS